MYTGENGLHVLKTPKLYNLFLPHAPYKKSIIPKTLKNIYLNAKKSRRDPVPRSLHIC